MYVCNRMCITYTKTHRKSVWYVSTAKQSSAVNENYRADAVKVTDIYPLPSSPMQYAPLAYNTGTNSEKSAHHQIYCRKWLKSWFFTICSCIVRKRSVLHGWGGVDIGDVEGIHLIVFRDSARLFCSAHVACHTHTDFLCVFVYVIHIRLHTYMC